jgi:hypothetical protein
MPAVQTHDAHLYFATSRRWASPSPAKILGACPLPAVCELRPSTMIWLPPPVWTLIYALIAAAISGGSFTTIFQFDSSLVF